MSLFAHTTTRKCIAITLNLILLCSMIGCGTSTSVSPKPTPTPSPTFTRLFSPHYQVKSQFNIAYGPSFEEQLDLCRPSGISTARPGIVLIHGGAFVAGDKRYQFDDYDTLLDVCQGLASQGFLVASINYRLAPDAIWPAQVVDAQLAVRWLRAHASEIKLNPQDLCTVGLSAGAYLSVFLGVLQKIHVGDRADLLASESPGVSCVVDFYGPVDLAQLVKTAPEPNQTVRDLLGYATPESNPDLYRAASPLFLVSSQSAPTLIIHGTQDTTVPIAQSQALEQALQKQRVSVQLITYPGTHSLGGLSQQQIRVLWTHVLDFLVSYQHP
jgi:acetyl esterase/lipase